MALPEETPSNKKSDPVSRFRESYANALADAEVQATHTKTEGWQRLYANFHRENRDKLASVSKRFRHFADTLELAGTHEELEKEVGEMKKELTSIRTEKTAFEENTTRPVKQCALDCQQIITEAISTARRQEQDAPLVNVGLEHLMRDAVAAVPKVSFDNESGVVTITDPE